MIDARKPTSRVYCALSLFESRRRWWGGKRASIVLVERKPWMGSKDVYTQTELARGTWKPPSDWRYREIEL